MTLIQGIDVSHYQTVRDFAALRAAGFRFCIVKATEGVDYTDPGFGATMAAMAAVPEDAPRFYPGVYHFGRPDHHPGRSGGEAEARFFVKTLQDAARACGMSLTANFLEPALDFEKYCQSGDGCTSASRDDYIDGFLAVVQGELGRRGMIYTGANTWHYQAGDTDRFAQAGVPLWQVAYARDGQEPTATPPRLPGSAGVAAWTPAIWQWSGGGEFAYYGPVPGVDGETDIDRLMGGEDLLCSLAAAGEAAGAGASIDPLADPWPPALDLATLPGVRSQYTARVQGILLGLGMGPGGLVASADGLPDGIFGPKTSATLRQFKRSQGLTEDDVVDRQTWWCLVNAGLRA